MKGSKLLFVATLFFCAACTRHETHIRGNLADAGERMAYITAYESFADGSSDSAMMRRGDFSFRVDNRSADVVFISFAGEEALRIPVIADGQPVRISGTLARPDEIKIEEGSPDNMLLQDYRNSMRKYDIMLRSIAMAGQSEADSTVLAQLTSKRDSINYLRSQIRRQFVQEHPRSVVSAMVLYAGTGDAATIPQIDAIFSQLDTVGVSNAFIDRLRNRRRMLENQR